MGRCVFAVMLLVLRIPLALSDAFFQSADVEFSLAPFSGNLTQQTVIQTFQDSHGNLWFLTQEGLNKYNGLTLENYRYSLTDPLSISHNSVTRIAEDSSGVLWISTNGGGLNKYDPIKNGFTSIYSSENKDLSPYSNGITTVFCDRDDILWLGYKNAFSSFNTRTGQFHHYTSDSTNLSSLGLINKFDQSADGRIWAASTGGGLIEIQPKQQKVVLHRHSPGDSNTISSNSIRSLVVDKNDDIWAVSKDAGISVFSLRTNKILHLKHEETDLNSLSSDEVWDVFEDSDGQIWIGTYEGLNVFLKDEKQFIRYTKQNSDLPSDRIFSIFQSREGKYWIGTFYGLASGLTTLFPKIDTDKAHLSSNSVNAFSETSDGSLWVGTDDGLNRLRPDSLNFEWTNEATVPGISSPDVMSLYAEEYLLWVGTFNGGLNRLDLKTNTTKTFRHNPLDTSSIGADGITSILRISNGQLLVGTFGGGLSIYQEESDNFINLKNVPGDNRSLSNDRVIALFEDSLGYVWVGTERGLNRYDPISFKFDSFYADMGNRESLSSDMVWAFYEDDKGSLWLGTQGGSLNRWDPSDRKDLRARFQHFSENISLPSSNVYGIKSDAYGNLWLSHNRGITKFNPITLETIHYGVRDGLQDPEFNMGAAYKSEDGVIYFGGNRGFNIINPDSIDEDNSPPLVSISSIKIMNERREFKVPYSDLKELQLNHKDRMLSIDFFKLYF
ncbi:MAG: two-component regulator propeller domain-containing protein [Halioglobus sp.]